MVSVAFVTLCCMALNSASTSIKLTMSTTSSTDPLQSTPPYRSITSSLSDQTNSIHDRASGMNQRAETGTPFTEAELDDVVNSIDNIRTHSVSSDQLRKLLQDVAHLSHKDWAVTGNNAKKLGDILLKDGVNEKTRHMLQRILLEGNWDGAAKHAATERPTGVQPWAVLVTGVNGIRKTTSIYQPWFPALLQEALVAPPNVSDDNGTLASTTLTTNAFDPAVLPAGGNSFFRQLDHMIATLCNEDFAALYLLTQELLTEFAVEDPPLAVVKKYSDLKAAIFTRFRTLSELLGALLLGEAQVLKSNCMMETSGRDVAMFHYVDHFFPVGYNKVHRRPSMG